MSVVVLIIYSQYFPESERGLYDKDDVLMRQSRTLQTSRLMRSDIADTQLCGVARIYSDSTVCRAVSRRRDQLDGCPVRGNDCISSLDASFVGQIDGDQL